jgi:sigma-B regulation protein RsbU (phosphoserine phosphatase)
MAAMVSAAAEAWRIIERGRIRFEAAQARENLVRLARAFQASLLPPALPAIAGVELAASYQPAEGEGEVGGDFYDVFPLGAGVWGLTIGDVCGRGPEAAALTSLARHTIRASATGRTDPGEVLTTLNDVVYEDLTRRERWGDFLSAVYLTFEVVDGGVDLDVANAGHPPPMVVRASGEVVELNEPGQVLGVTASAPTARAAARLAPGDALVLVTDGVTEAHIPGQAQFGETRMAAVLSDVAGQPPATIVAALVDAVRAHTEGQAGRDDVAMVCLSPLSAGWPRRPR